MDKIKKHIILIADDDKYIRVLLKRELEALDYKVIVVDSGNKLIKLLKNRNVRLIITDIYMEGKDGFEVISAVKKVNDKLPIIVITGDNEIEMERKIRGREILAFFVKPLEMKFLNKTVKAAMGHAE